MKYYRNLLAGRLDWNYLPLALWEIIIRKIKLTVGEVKKNIVKGRCATKRTNKTHGRSLCNTCRTRKWRKENPVQSAYLNLKNNAKRRNILFTITLEQFEEWCSKVIYIGHSGRASESWTIDRRHNDIGYHIDNIKVMTKGDNVKKYFYYDWRTKTVAYSTDETPVMEEETEDIF